MEQPTAPLLSPEFQEQPALKDNTPMFSDLWGMIPTLSAAPTYTPRKFSEQIVLYSSAGTYKLYIYDTSGQAWRSVTLT